MKIKFDKDFWWGTATSGPQTEGSYDKKHMNIMDYWFSQNPEDFFDGVGPYEASDTYHKFKDDINIASRLNLNSFRTSIQWTRIIDDFEENDINPRGVKFYREYFQGLKNKGIKVIVNLFHFDMPLYWQEKGGWENRETIDAYVEYAKICFRLFGDIVDEWMTFNEPLVPAEAGYLEGLNYPKLKDLRRAAQVGYNTILASAKAIKAFHEIFNDDPKKEIGVILNLTPTYPRDKNNPCDVYAAEVRDELYNKSFLDSAVKGKFDDKLIKIVKDNNLLGEYKPEDKETIKNGIVDYLGVNFYQPLRVKAEFDDVEKISHNINKINDVFTYYRDPDAVYNEYRGWEIRPNTLYEIAMTIKNDYGNIKWYVSENGMGVEGEEKFKDKNGVIQDDYRIDFIKEHLYWLHKAIEEGSNCVGYHLWTFIDCWSWAHAYKNRYGLVSVDLFNQKRRAKKSGRWFAECIKNNEFEIEDKLTKPYK